MKKVLALILALTMVGALAACGSSPKTVSEQLAGQTYTLLSLDFANQEATDITAENIDAYKQMLGNDVVTVVFGQDGTGTIDMSGTVYNFTYDDEKLISDISAYNAAKDTEILNISFNEAGELVLDSEFGDVITLGKATK